MNENGSPRKDSSPTRGRRPVGSRRASVDAWISTIARIVGLALLLAFGVVWIVTALQGHAQKEVSLVGAALTLYGVGVLGRAKTLLDRLPDEAIDRDVDPPGTT